MYVEQTDNVAVGDLLRAAVDRAVHLPRRRPLHHHLRGDPPQDARGQRRAAQDLHKLGSGYVALVMNLVGTEFCSMGTFTPMQVTASW